MFLRYSLFFVFISLFNEIYSEDLDTLITSLAKAQTDQAATTTVTSPESVVNKAPVDVVPSSEAQKIVMPEPKPKVVAAPKVVSEPTLVTEPKPKVVEPQPIAKAGMVTIVQPSVVAAPVVAKSESAESKVVIQPGEVTTVSAEGLDTLHIDSSGNWLEKRIWYQKAEQMFEDIRKTVEKASDIRMKFVHEVSVIGKHIDDFYEKVSFEKGQIDELLQAVLGSLTTEEKVRGGDLSSSERDIKLNIHENQQELQSIETNIKMISGLDEQVEKTMIKAFQEIDACRAFENKAWNNFKDIGMELDDKRARTLYYEMKNFYENIQKKIDYLQSNLYEYLVNQLGSKIIQTTSQIQTTVQSLKAKGINLESLLERDSTGDFVVLKQRDEMKAKEAAAKLTSKEVESSGLLEKKIKTAWYQNLWCFILEYLCPIFTKLSEWATIIFCCIQTLLCKIQEWICRILGY
ncbi:hypothetical protein HYV10_03805 [Candidatus Dependentiae bacterium]|nr:hypothetical protein [Candidatus Dependentiae bacterium]